MKKEVATIDKPKTKRVMPDMRGVPGELVDAAALPPDVIFGNRKISPYVAVLMKLQESPTQVLRFGDVRARASVWSQGKKLGIPIECAEVNGVLYVRMKDFHGDRAKERREAILGLLKVGGPTPAPKIAVVLRDKGDATVDGQMVTVILEQLARTGEVVKQEGGSWLFRRKTAAA